MTGDDDLDEDEEWVPGEALPVGEDGEEPRGEEEAKTYYPDLPSFVTVFVAPTVRRRLGGSLTWCGEWFKHSEAISRLNCVWHEWEKARVEGTMSNWWLYHLGPHMDVLMSKEAGPFMDCKPTEHRPLKPLPLESSDPLLWTSSAFTDPAAPTGRDSAAESPAASGSGSAPVLQGAASR